MTHDFFTEGIMKRILTIAGSDSGGGAGIQADLKAIAALGGYGMSVITALTAQNTAGVQGVYPVPEEFVELQFDSVASDIGVDAAKTGMLAASGVIRTAARKIRQYGIELLVVDPVMVAKGGARLIEEDAIEALVRELIPIAFMVTPNIPEAEVLSGLRISSPREMKTAAAAIQKMGARHVVVKGGHLEGGALDVLYDGERFREFAAERIETRDTHGTGCTFSAALAFFLADGLRAEDAVARAKTFITTAIRNSIRVGSGHGPTNPLAALIRKAEGHDCIRALSSAVERLKSEHCGRIIPEVQSNLGYALPGATIPSEVAAVPGRIIRMGADVFTFREPAFGASSHIARIILTVMRFRPEYRAAMNIRFSEEIIAACRDLGLDTDSFSRADEPEEVKRREGSSLEWGTDYVLARRGSIPDVIFDRGDVGKEPMVRVLGRDPEEVVAKIIKIAGRLA